MFTISAPERPYIGQFKERTLIEAIKIKAGLENFHEGCHAVITDKDGYVVSTLEQRNYLCGYYF